MHPLAEALERARYAELRGPGWDTLREAERRTRVEVTERALAAAGVLARITELEERVERAGEAEAFLAQRDAEIARLTREHDDEVTRLVREHAAEVARLRTERDDEVARLRTERDDEVARLRTERDEATAAAVAAERELARRALARATADLQLARDREALLERELRTAVAALGAVGMPAPAGEPSGEDADDDVAPDTPGRRPSTDGWTVAHDVEAALVRVLAHLEDDRALEALTLQAEADDVGDASAVEGESGDADGPSGGSAPPEAVAAVPTPRDGDAPSSRQRRWSFGRLSGSPRT